MIAAGLIAIALAGQPALTPISEPAGARYYVRRKRRPVTLPAPAVPHAVVVEELPPRRVRTIPLIDYGEFYRRVGL